MLAISGCGQTEEDLTSTMVAEAKEQLSSCPKDDPKAERECVSSIPDPIVKKHCGFENFLETLFVAEIDNGQAELTREEIVTLTNKCVADFYFAAQDLL